MQRLQQIIGIFILSLFFISFAGLPFWRITHDSVLIQYITLLIDEFGRVPYADIFDTALPGTLLLHLFAGKVFGHTESGLQFFNFLFCSVFILCNFNLLKGFSLIPRLVGSIFFIFWYLSFGHEMSLERDFTATFFIALAYLVSYKLEGRVINFVLLGFLMGVTFTIKPHLAVGAPIFFYLLNKHSLEGFWEKIGASFFGFVLPIAGSLFWLKQTKGLEGFFDMVTNYLPQYVEIISREHRYFPTFFLRVKNKLQNYFYYVPYWRVGFFMLCFGSFVGWMGHNHDRKKIFFNFLLFCLYSTTLILSGQFFTYHFSSLLFFAYLPIVYLFSPLLHAKYDSLLSLSLVLIAFFSVVYFPVDSITLLKGEKAHLSYNQRVDHLTGVLKKELKETDTLFYFDWVEGGVAHALFNLRIPIKFKYTTDQIFKHHLHLDQKQERIKNFVKKFKKSPPSVLVVSKTHNYPKGPFTKKDLPHSINSFIRQRYSTIFEDNNYEVFRLAVKK